MDPKLLQKRISQLPPEKRAVFDRLRTQSQGGDASIRPRDRRADPPRLSFSQEQLWFLDQLAPGNWFYNESSALHLTFDVNSVILEAALNEVVRRHEALRTSFGLVQGEPAQIIAPDLQVPLAIIDLTHLPKAEREAESRRLAAEDAQRPFNLGEPPLVRSTLLYLGVNDFILLLTMHHIIFDGWSFTILLREMSQVYEARSAGRAPVLPDLPIQYADYAVWQRKSLQGEALAAKIAYWRNQLTNAPVLDLPTDRQRSPVQRFRGARYPMSISKSRCQAVRALGASQGMTLFMTLLTVFKVLLHRYSGQEDIVVGVPIANRHKVEVEPLIGFFVNTLVMRTDLSGEPTFTEALSRVRKVTLDAFAHQDLPFEKLVEELRPRRDLSRNPMFQVTFQLYGSGAADEFAGPSIDGALPPFEIESLTAKFDLRFDLAETSEGLNGFLEYDSDLFDRETIEAVAKNFNMLLESAIADPHRRISELEMFPSDERRRMLVEWNQTTTDYPRDCCIHKVFEAQVESTPEATALEFADEVVTYADLNRRANQLASYLRRLGVGPGSLVGMSNERSIEMIVGLLGILKSGAAYLPLDLDDARDRLSYLTSDAKVSIVLTRERQLFHLADRGIRVIPLGLESVTIGLEPSLNPECGVGSEDLAYIMYTSGSTGKPKGVCVPHRAVVRLVRNTNFFTAGTADTFLQFATLSFDASTFEIWGALLNGARLKLFPPYVPSLEELAAAVQDRVTVLWLTAAIFHAMVESHLRSLTGLRHLLAGGDVLSPAHVKKLLEAAPNCELTNGYGPTENTTFTCTYSMSGPGDFGSSFPIGRPISNTRVYVLDRFRKPVPVHVPGELYVGGDGLAIGYLNAPELTAEKFVSNPLPEERGAYLYRTGDQVRYRRDGNIEFIGRTDFQVKVRGFRVELGEIESVLRELETVSDAVCVVDSRNHGEKRLLAYVVASGGGGSDKELRRFLQRRLPDYMIPAAIIALESIPVTANGKIDREALPAPEHTRPELDTSYAPPRTDVERAIGALWQELLGVDTVGIDDNFFDLGGHSLLLVMLHNRLTEMFRQDLSIVDLFRYPTVSSLAKLLSPEEARGRDTARRARPASERAAPI